MWCISRSRLNRMEKRNMSRGSLYFPHRFKNSIPRRGEVLSTLFLMLSTVCLCWKRLLTCSLEVPRLMQCCLECGPGGARCDQYPHLLDTSKWCPTKLTFTFHSQRSLNHDRSDRAKIRRRKFSVKYPTPYTWNPLVGLGAQGERMRYNCSKQSISSYSTS